MVGKWLKHGRPAKIPIGPTFRLVVRLPGLGLRLPGMAEFPAGRTTSRYRTAMRDRGGVFRSGSADFTLGGELAPEVTTAGPLTLARPPGRPVSDAEDRPGPENKRKKDGGGHSARSYPRPQQQESTSGICFSLRFNRLPSSGARATPVALEGNFTAAASSPPFRRITGRGLADGP
jgi:hypothetical protein